MDFLTNLNLLVLFAVIGGIGFLILLISLVVGDLFEAIGFDAGPGLDSGVDFGFSSREIDHDAAAIPLPPTRRRIR